MQYPPNPSRANNQPALRASDADRERVATALQKHYAEGRLNYDELQDRLQTTYAAKTLGELDIVVHDLPEKRPSKAAAVSRATSGATRRRRNPTEPIASFLVFAAFFTIIWLATGAHGHFWPIWPILIVGLITASRVIRGLGN